MEKRVHPPTSTINKYQQHTANRCDATPLSCTDATRQTNMHNTRMNSPGRGSFLVSFFLSHFQLKGGRRKEKKRKRSTSAKIEAPDKQAQTR